MLREILDNYISRWKRFPSDYVIDKKSYYNKGKGGREPVDYLVDEIENMK